MKAAVQTGLRRIELLDVEEPGRSDDTAIVRVRAAGICGSDLHPYRERSEPRRDPEGHEVSGELLHLPRDYRGPLKVGDLVAADNICLGTACAECEHCRAGLPVHCAKRVWMPPGAGAFGESFETKPAGLFKLPDGMSLEQGALVEPLAVGVHAVRYARMPAGATCAVIGAGTIGLMQLIAARALGAGDVHVLARHDHQARLAEELGAASVIRSEGDEAAEALRAATGGAGADYVFETVGGQQGETMELSWKLARRMGTVVVLGVFTGPVPVHLGRPLGRELWAVFPVCYGYQDGQHDFEVAIDLIAGGKAPVEKLVTHRFPLGQAPEAFGVADDKATGSVKVHLVAD